MPSPIVTVDGYSTVDGVNVAAGGTVTIQLSDLTGVTNWSISCIDSDDLQSPANITDGLTINNATRTATLTAPSTTRGSALIFQSQINNGKDLNGSSQTSYTTTFAVFVVGSSGLRLLARNQTTQGDADFGWTSDINAILARGGATPAATDTIAGTIKITGDLSGDSTAPVVVGLQNRDVSNAAPEDGYVLTWNDSLSHWEPQDAPSGGSSDATTTTNGVVRLAGDLGGASTTAAAPRVSGINGATVPAAGSLTTDHVLKVSGSSALSYGFIDNDNIAGAAAIEGTKINPSFGSQDISALGSLTVIGACSLGGNNVSNTISGSLTVSTRQISTATYTVDAAGTKDLYLFARTDVTATTITLPSPTDGRVLFVVDTGNNASVNNITISPNASETINGGSGGASITLSVDSYQARIISDGTNWWVQ